MKTLSIFSIFIVAAAISTTSNANPIFAQPVYNYFNDFQSALQNSIAFVDYELFSFVPYKLESVLSYLAYNLPENLSKKERSYITKTQANYTFLLAEVNQTIGNFKEPLLASLREKQDQLSERFKVVEQIVDDVENFLIERRCPESRIKSFFSDYFFDVTSNAFFNFNGVYENYRFFGYQDQVPFELLYGDLNKLSLCIELSGGVPCLKKVEEVFLSSSLDLINETADRIREYLLDLNNKIAQKIVSETDQALSLSYREAIYYSRANC